MDIKILAVGRLKEKFWVDACNEYLKRLKPYANVKVIEIKECYTGNNPSDAELQSAKITEGAKLLKYIDKTDILITLEVDGKGFSSEAFAKKIQSFSDDGIGSIVFVIGGSTGLAENVTEKSNLALSFSKMTFPHHMMRVFLLEQIYRAFKINRGETYHK